MTVGRRRLGSQGPWLSEITYGTMRLTEGIDGASAADYLCLLHDHGIDTHHSSHEYDSHERYLEALRRARSTGRTFQHIVKLSEPSFDHERFDGDRLTKRLDAELTTLGVDEITSLQWLYRTPDSQNTEARVVGLRDQQDEIRSWIETQLRSGKVGNVSVFPYSVGFARAALEVGLSTTLATYLNLVELDYVSLLDEVDGFIAIRPLAGGRLVSPGDGAGSEGLSLASSRYLAGCRTGAERVGMAVRFSLLHPAVATSVISINSSSHLEAVLCAVAGQTSDRAEFDNVVSRLGSARTDLPERDVASG